MKNKILFGVAFLAFISASGVLNAQYNIAEIGLAQGTFKAAELDINTNLIGLHAGIEVPLATYSFRLGYDYLSRVGSATDGKKSLSHLSALKFLGGKVFNSGHRVQFLVFGGGYAMTPVGDIQLPEDKKSVFGFSSSAGTRIYISNRFSVFGEALFDIGLVPDYTYTNSDGVSITSNMPIRNLAFSVGIAFVYLNKKK
ncbi:MAG TPA: hypothetical protein PKB07_01815 [Flavilitoribacter sp.]|nr:hypothetical protein [Flavilitoribacter sp.]